MQVELDRIYLMDCREGMKQMPADFVDLIVTDPPFAIHFRAKRSNYNRTQGRVLEGYNEVPAEEYYEFTLSWMREAYRVLKGSGSMYVFSGWNNLKDILNALDEVGFITVNHIIWKYQFGVCTKRRFVTSHYHCLYVCKDDRLRRFYPDARFAADSRLPDGGNARYRDMEDVWVIPREYWNGDVKTPTKLPAELIRKILQYSSREGDIVLDPFLGSGQVAVVAQQMARRYIGFEIVPQYYEFALRRLKEGVYRLRAGGEELAARRRAR
ncbi:MAG: site-specific DNA-methyltransferase [Armatimonadota bacterium]|nr:site-specific DNA-methyltransferase [Armatimonadota bacterium]